MNMRILLLILCLWVDYALFAASSRVGYVQYYDNIDHLLAAPKNVSDVAVVREVGGLTTDDGAIFYYVAGATSATNTTTVFAPPYGGRWFRAVANGAGTGTISDIEVANTLFVDPTNGNDASAARGRQDLPYLTIDAALADLTSGDTLVLRPGTYSYTRPGMPSNSSAYSQHSNANLEIQGKTNVTILGYGAVIASTGLGNVLSLTDVTNVTVRGVTFDGPGYNAAIAAQICGEVVLWGTNQFITFADCTFMDFPNHGILVSQTEKTSRNTRIENCTFLSGGTMNHTALTVDGAGVASTGPGMVVTGCTFDRVVRGVEIEGSGTLAKGPAVISNNLFTNVYNQAIILLETSGAEGLLLTDVVISGNVIALDKTAHSAAGQYGITCSGGRRIAVTGNTIRRANNWGISFGTTDAGLRATTITGNVVSECGGGIAVYDPNAAIIYDNIIEGNVVTGTTGAAGAIYASGNATLIKGNIIADSDGWGIFLTPPPGDDRATNIMVVGNLIRTTLFAPIGIDTDCYQTVVQGNNIRYAYGGAAISDSGTGTLIEYYDAIETASGDVDTRIDSKMDESTTIDNIADADVAWSEEKAFDNLLFRQAASYTHTNVIGTAYTLDWTGPPIIQMTVTGDVTVALGSTPAQGTYAGRTLWLQLANNQATNVTYTGPEITCRSFDNPVGVVSERFLDLFFYWDGTNATYWWAGPQDSELAMDRGGTAVPTGIAPAGLDVLGSIAYTSTTNAEFDLRSGTVFRLDNTKDALINAVASRVSSTESNTLVLTRGVEMIGPSANRIVWVNTNNFGLYGLAYSNFVPAGSSMRFTLVNWGPEAHQNYISGISASGSPSGGGGAGTDYTENLIAAFVMTNSSGDITDASGNGYTMTPLGGSFTYQVAASLEDYAITNASDSSLVLTNPAASLQRDGADSFTLLMRVRPQTASASQTALSRYDSSLNKVMRVRTSGGVWVLGYYTNATGATFTSTFPVEEDWQNIAVFYDASEPSLYISVDGGSLQGLSLNAPLQDVSVPLAIGGFLNNNLASTGGFLGAFEIVALWSDVKTLGFIQEASAKRFDEWAP